MTQALARLKAAQLAASKSNKNSKDAAAAGKEGLKTIKDAYKAGIKGAIAVAVKKGADEKGAREEFDLWFSDICDNFKDSVDNAVYEAERRNTNTAKDVKGMVQDTLKDLAAAFKKGKTA